MNKLENKYQSFRPSELALYHKNPRVGDVDAIAASLRAHGQYAPIIVNVGTHTGRPNEVLKGNHTLKAFRDLAEKHPDDERWQAVECRLLDVDDDQAARIVAVDNRTSELGSFDDEALFELLSGLPDLEGTGYEKDNLDELEELLSGSAGEDQHDDGVATSDEGGEAAESDRAPSTGEMLSIVDISVAEPTHQPSHGSVWRMGKHILVVAKLAEEHHLWSKYLEEGVVFAPYPEPFLSTCDKAIAGRFLFVQPNKYMAGHLLDKHASAFPDDEVVEQ